MYIYHDIKYVEYIFNLPWQEGLSLYNKCIGRLNDIENKNHEDRIFLLYLFELEHCEYKGNFEDYKNIQKIEAENKNMSKENFNKEYNRILSNSQKILKIDRERRKRNV